MPKNIIVCSDGTWNKPDMEARIDEDGEKKTIQVSTNVVHFRRATTGVGGQLTLYDAGVGSDNWSRFRGGFFGWGLEGNIRELYEGLAKHYEPGDDIYAIGFSRGAFTIRALVGMISRSGLLKEDNAGKRNLKHAWKFYKKNRPKDEGEIKSFKEAYCHNDLRVKFLGVFDTVQAQGMPIAIAGNTLNIFHRFHDAKLSPIVQHARQALAVDEERTYFKPTLWKHLSAQCMANGHCVESVEQRWFPGAHSDVGGGYPEKGLSDYAFDWMRREAEGVGLAFDERYIQDNIAPKAEDILHDSMTWYYRAAGRLIRGIDAIIDRATDDNPPYANETIDASIFYPIEREDGTFEHHRQRRVDLEALHKERRRLERVIRWKER
jgi:uncharacterized protein (DUF2235 family)